MAGTCLLRPASAGAISVPQFLDHFRRVWTESRVSGIRIRGCPTIPRRLGLAVSGGADSMALAYLCKQLERSGLLEGLSVTAFVVDHKAREESSREANTVARWLFDIGVTTKILELEWPTTTSKSHESGKPSAFETHARRLRFQALGTACRDDQIETLMMGHHQDDNVETTLWRLSTGARGAGLAGIPPVARIPECHGLYGVSESGMSFTLSKPGLLSGREIKQDPQSPKQRVSTGGISISRPLLSFPKTNLLATCHDHGIPYVTDTTNFDPTLTPRNAIRSLLSSNSFPRALSPLSILQLIKKSRDLIGESVDLSNGLLRCCELVYFRLTSGTVVVRFPSSTTAEGGEPTPPRRKIQAITLRRITELISPFPENHFPLRSFENFTDRLFQPPSSLSFSSKTKQPFTLGGVMFQPLPWKSTNNNNNTNTDNTTENGNTWFLSRQPFMRHRLPTLRLEVPIPSTSIPQNQNHQHQHQHTEQTYTPWTLWDDRYWFRCTLTPRENRPHTDTPSNIATEQNNKTASTSMPVILRPLQQSDLHRIRHLLSLENTPDRREHPMWTRLIETLSREAPNQSRFTIPVLAIHQKATGKDEILALPTMELRLPPSELMSVPEKQWEIQWEWMFKMIDDETVKSLGWLDDR